jgi:ubiquinone/menaquinone biosynthesis C-methylase UbiE
MFLPGHPFDTADMRKTNRPDIETSGVKARFYDQLVFLGTIGLYQKLLRRVIEDMDIGARDRILDLGAGTGKNALLMNGYLDGGSITALEIGMEMRRQFEKKCGNLDNIHLENRRIDSPLPYRDQFDKVLLSFVLHGFEAQQRREIVLNAHRALKPGGRLLIFDWNEFDLDCSGPVMRFFMHHIECSPARDFIRNELGESLLASGFSDVESVLYVKNRIRLLTAKK